MLKSKPTLWLLLAVALYSVGHLTWYLQTPLGLSPALDGQENLILAEQISSGTLAAEPFYRAMLYPFILAYWPAHWAILGLIAHIANTYLVYRLSFRIWKHLGGALLSGTLVGFNPILLHYAFDPLDITLAITCFILGLSFIPEALDRSRFADRWLSSSRVGLFFSIAGLMRPHFFAVIIPIALIAIFAMVTKKVEWQRSTLFLLFAAIPIIAYGSVQLSVNGQFKVLPWQGAYNLWASNKPEANGFYYRQTLEFHYLDEHKNPTRLESETLYKQETGTEGTIDSRSAYWRKKTLNSVASNPFLWIKLMTSKTYALLNNYEQYNNKTFSFHRNLSPWLRYNPICWGLLSILAVASVSTLWRQVRTSAIPFIVISATFSAGVILYMASGRFRTPIIPILAVFAGGLPFAIQAYKASGSKTRRTSLIATGIMAIATFSFLGGINSKDTYIQDTLLLADTSAKIGRDHEAIKWASAALELSPNRQGAKRIRLISGYNLLASGEIASTKESWLELANDAFQITLEDELLPYVQGLVHWNLGDKNKALQVWHEGYNQFQLSAAPCLAAIIIAKPNNFQANLTPDLLAELQAHPHPLLNYAIAKEKAGAQRTTFLESVQMTLESYTVIERNMQRVLPQ